MTLPRHPSLMTYLRIALLIVVTVAAALLCVPSALADDGPEGDDGSGSAVGAVATDPGAALIADESSAPPKPAVYQENDPKLTYMGKWATTETSWAGMGRFVYANSSGAVVTASFKGTSIKLTAKKGPEYGKAKVRLDGGKAEYIDFYSPSAACQQFVYQKEGLADTAHTLTLEWAGVKNDASSGYYISLDVLVVQGALTQAPGITRYQQDASQLSYAGHWSTYSSGSTSAGNFAYTDSKGSAVNITFRGTALALIANMGSVYGKARLSLDGGAPFLVDLYSAGSLYQQMVYCTGALDEGTHNLTIQWTGVANAYSKDRFIGIDALDVMGSLVTASAPPPGPTLYQQTDPKLIYAGTWGTADQWGASGGTFKYATTQGASLTIKFGGSCLDLIGKKSPQYGKARAILDGVDVGYVDFYDPDWTYQELVYTTGPIAGGQHTLILEWAGVKNGASTGYLINVDAVSVCGSLVETPVPRHYQQSAEPLVYAGAWVDVVNTAADGGNLYYANSPDASLMVEFDGTSLDWYAKTSFVYGKALLSLDGGAEVEVDMYSAATLYRQRVYSTGLLENGRHTLSIRWSGRKNASSIGCAINVDCFNTVGSMAVIAPDSLTSDRRPFAMTYQGKTRVTYTLARAPAWVSATPGADGDLYLKVWDMSGPALPLTIEAPEVHSVMTSFGGGAATIRLDLARYQRYRVMSLPATQSRAARIVVDVYTRSDGPPTDGPPLVYLDPGHGGSATGTAGVVSEVAEKTVNLAVGRLATSYLSGRGVKVVLTRSADTYLTLQQRCDLANSAGASIFISIHCNSFFNRTTGGTETFYQEKTPEYTTAAKALATALQSRVLAALGLSDRGARTYYVGTLGVLNGTVMPAALVELGFMSNPAEDALLTSSAGQDKSARAIADAVCDYLRWSTAVYSSE